jgi:regulator of replication initiation timing
VSSRTARATRRNPVSKNPKKKKEERKKKERKILTKPGVVTHICNLHMGSRSREDQEFKSSLAT